MIGGFRNVELVVLLFIAVIALGTLARRLVVPYPILLVVGGLALGFIPGLPAVRLDPDLVFFVFLPPILWAAAYFTSLRDFRRNARPITLLAVGLVLATTGVVAAVAHHMIPGMSWAGAVVLGAIVSPPDAVAAVAILRRLHIPHRVVVILEGESLVNDAMALVLYRTAVAAVVTGAFSLNAAVGQFFVSALGGVVVGLAVGWLALVSLRSLHDSMTEIAVTLIAPYVAWSMADRIHASAVLACVVGGIFLRRSFSSIVAPSTRLQARAVWDLLVFALNGAIFFLIGLQLRTLIEAVPSTDLLRLGAEGLVVSAAAIATRLLWVPVATAAPRLIPGVRARDPLPPWQSTVLVAWTGMRGVVSLAAALGLPFVIADGRPFPLRETVILLTFVVILVTLVVQGLTLAPLTRRLRPPEDPTLEREERHARERATQAALQRLEEIERAPWADPEQLVGLRRWYEKRARTIAEQHDGSAPPSSSLEQAVFKRARHQTLAAERQALIQLRDEGTISDEVLLDLERELDVEAARHGLAESRHTAD
jgi:Na+/H+ antiporter